MSMKISFPNHKAVHEKAKNLLIFYQLVNNLVLKSDEKDMVLQYNCSYL